MTLKQKLQELADRPGSESDKEVIETTILLLDELNSLKRLLIKAAKIQAAATIYVSMERDKTSGDKAVASSQIVDLIEAYIE